MNKSEQFRVWLVKRIWKDKFRSGWATIYWNASQREQDALDFLVKHAMVERDGAMYRLTDSGRAWMHDVASDDIVAMT